MKRIAFYLYYDKDGIVDDYVVYKLKCLREHVDTIFVVSNSVLNQESHQKLETVADTIHYRENKGFDVWGYKEGMETFGIDNLENYDELILMNYTFFAPIFPFSEMFDTMEKRACDFWGVSDHGSLTPNPFTGVGILPYHLQSHFISIRKNMFGSDAFKNYWRLMPPITSYTDSVLMHESQFTERFSKLGYTHSVYCGEANYPTEYPTFKSIEETLANRCPILKRRPFFHEPLFLDHEAIQLSNVINYIKYNSAYDTNLIWQNLLRTVPPKDLFSNLELLKVFGSEDIVDKKNYSNLKIAVIAHVYYPDMMEEILKYIENIPYHFDLYITTASEESKIEIANFLSTVINQFNLEIRVVEQNRGRDIGSLLITCKDINLNSKYDYICRVHSKKSPQVGYNTSQLFKKHMYENLLESKAYIYKLINFFEDNPIVGFLMPTMVHIGYPTLGHSWFCNKIGAKKVAKTLDIKTPFDDAIPHAAFGTMFWYRPQALKKLFQHEWKWEDFNQEPSHVDGSLSHIIERLFVYATHDAGYVAYNISTTKSMEKNYSKLEYKTNRLMSRLSNGSVLIQVHMLEQSVLLNYYITKLKIFMLSHFPNLSNVLKGPYKKFKAIYRRYKG